MKSTVRRDSRLSMPTEYSDMGSVASIAAFSRSLIKREQLRTGIDAEQAIRRVAGRIKVGPGTFGNIIRKRVKTICFDIARRIVNAALTDIENERRQLENERALLLDLGPNASPHDLAEVEANLEAARAGLARMRGQA